MEGIKDGSIDVSVEGRLVGGELGAAEGSEVEDEDEGVQVGNRDGRLDDNDEGDFVRFNDGKVVFVSDEINEGSTVGLVEGLVDGS